MYNEYQIKIYIFTPETGVKRQKYFWWNCPSFKNKFRSQRLTASKMDHRVHVQLIVLPLKLCTVQPH